MELLTIGIALLPLWAALLAGTLGPTVARERTHRIIIIGVGGAAVCSFLLMWRLFGGDVAASQTLHLFDWFSSGSSNLSVNFKVDALTAVMLVTVTSVATLVVVYSRDYMRHDGHAERGYERFFAFLGLFVFSMCVLVLAGNFLLLYLGWEAVGLSSYLLIGFYYKKPEAAAAAKKAFLVNRIGDFGFGVGILLIYLKCGNLDYDYVLSAQGIAQLGDHAGWVALLLFCGAVGKSAQLPLYVWLPDAMEGPTPVSALIHAATMVTAGVYMVARCGAIFVADPLVMQIVAYVGGFTALFAATIAVVQYDLKRILAYSTMSQLGYMFMGLGVYAADAAVFHLFTHAFFKALLFLAAGSVMHALGGVIDVRRFAGLRGVIPVTFWTFLIGALALSGFPFLSGFYSKDMIIHHALETRPLLGIIGLVTAALTAFYTARMVFLAFWGDPKLPEGVHAHESGGWMLTPLVLLSIPAIAAGFVFHHSLPNFLSDVLAPFSHGSAHATVSATWVAVGSAIIAILGIALAWMFYVGAPHWPDAIRRRAGVLFNIVHNKYYVDEGYDKTVVRPLWGGGQGLFLVDRFFVDGLVWVVSAVPRFIGFCLRGLQGGSLQGYGVTMVGGFAVLVFVFVWYSRAAAS
jgi:NADH-quinone oxidoreductase subunit L